VMKLLSVMNRCSCGFVFAGFPGFSGRIVGTSLWGSAVHRRRSLALPLAGEGLLRFRGFVPCSQKSSALVAADFFAG